MEGKEKKERQINVICFAMVYSIGFFAAVSLMYDIFDTGISVLLKPFAVRYVTLIIATLFGSITLLFGDANKYLYPIGATIGIIGVQTFLINKAINALVTFDNTCEIITSILSFAASIFLAITIIGVFNCILKKKPIKKLLSFFAIFYMLIILAITLVNGYEKIFLDYDSVYASIMMMLQYFLLINAQLVVYVLVRQARKDKYIN